MVLDYPFKVDPDTHSTTPQLVCDIARYGQNDSSPARTTITSGYVDLYRSCGPIVPDHYDTAYIRKREFKYTCPDGEGSVADFEYRWYYDRVMSKNLIKPESKYLDEDIRQYTLPRRFICEIQNKHTRIINRFILTVEEKTTDQKSLLWVVVPAALIIMIVPLTYLAYLKWIGELDLGCNCKETVLEDDVDYVITQIAESSNPKSDDKKKNKPATTVSKLALLKRTLRNMSSAVNRISSNHSLSVTVAASLPMTTSQTKIKASKRMRNNRAEFLKLLNWPTLFRRPGRKIKKQSEKDYEDDLTHWIASGIRKVDRWQATTGAAVTTSHSTGTINDKFIRADWSRMWGLRLEDYKDRVNISGVPCKRETWLDMHRNIGPDKIEQFSEAEIIELSETLNNMYKLITPEEKFFPWTKKIREPFETVLNDPNHEHHNLIKKMWDNLLDRMFVAAYCVSSFHKLCKKVLDLTLMKYANPEKRKASDEKDDDEYGGENAYVEEEEERLYTEPKFSRMLKDSKAEALERAEQKVWAVAKEWVLAKDDGAMPVDEVMDLVKLKGKPKRKLKHKDKGEHRDIAAAKNKNDMVIIDIE